MDKIAFVKTGWATSYDGDPVVGRHEHIESYDEAHEKFNFKPSTEGRFYAYIPPMGEYKVPPKPDVSSKWLIIFVAAKNGNGPLTVVGWYRNAQFHNDYISRPEYELDELELDVHGEKYSYCISTCEAFLIPNHLRDISISGKHFKRSPIIYVRGGKKNDAWRIEFARLAESIVSKKIKSTEFNSPNISFPDKEHRKKVEEAAIEKAFEVLSKKYDVVDRQKDACGYDLLITHKITNEQLLIEVKGTSNDRMHFFMTRKELELSHDPRWRLFMVSDALNSKKYSLMDKYQVNKVFDLSPLAWEGTTKI
ncbi:protein NO VEIN domain-containing protein [Dickeya dianthicola]|uniref:protein NO VEIN domain-containing protein n=1 Tax=Dickeya dianthicola TaxID=204039 RepID=UPI00301A8A37